MSDLVARLRLEATSGNVPAVAAQTKQEIAAIGEAAKAAGASTSTAAAGADQLAEALGRTAEASKSAGGAAVEAAGRAMEQAQAEAAVTAGAGALAESREAVAASEGVLAAAHEAAGKAAEAAGEATEGLSDALDGAEKASGGASKGMSGLLALINPVQLGLVAAGAAMWAVNEALAIKRERAEAAAASDKIMSQILIEAAASAHSAASGSRTFGEENAAAVSGTNALALATRGLAAETFRLANAKAEEARQDLKARGAKLAAEISDLENPGWLEAGGRLMSRAFRASGQVGAAATTNWLFPDPTARLRDLNSAQAENTRLLIDMVLDPESWKKEKPDLPAAGGAATPTDRPGEMLAALTLEEAALKAHSEAAVRGEAALDAWRIADAGAQAVARAGLATTDAAAAGIRARAEAVERLMIADERISQAAAFARAADRDREALERRAKAALEGERALDDLRVVEAGLAVLAEARVTHLNQLEGKEREAVALAVQAAEARERQAIATAKAEAAGKSIEELTREIDAEIRKQAAIGQGIAAEVAYARAEYIRSEIERAGLKITDEAAAGIRAKAEALFSLQAATEGLETADAYERELRLARLTNREREIAVRTEAEAARLMSVQADLSEQAALAQAERSARAQVEAEETAAAIGRISSSMRDAFIRDGRLAFDDLETYAAERLRAAVYDAFLARPIDILINATVSGINDIAKQLFSGSAAEGFIGKMMSAGVGRVIGGAGVGGAIGGAMGLGSGNGLVDMGLSMGGSYLGGMAGSALSAYAANSSLMMLAGSAGAPLAGLAAALGPIMGPLGALAGVALGTLLKDEKRPYTRADIVAQGGQWTVAGTEAADGAAKDVADKLGKAITDSLNAATSLFGIDLAKVEGLYTTAGYVTGGNYKALGGEGYFGGDIRGLIDFYGQAGRDKKGNTLGAGVSFSQVGDAEALAEQVVRETLLRAIAAGASDLSEAEIQLVKAASSLEEAIGLIQGGRSIAEKIDDLMLEMLDPAAFEKKKALAAVEATYQALKSEAEALVEAGLVSGDILKKIEQLKALQIDSALNGLTGGGNVFAAARDGLLGWIDRLKVSNLSPLGVADQRAEAEDQFRRMLALAQSGDSRAISEITAYAERLLEADRAATGSAARRTALFEEVTASVRALAERTAPVEPLTATAISGPIVAALQGSDTAIAALLLSLPAETAGPLLEAILREPDWAATLLGQNAYVPLALTDLAAAVNATPAGTASPIVAALMTTPDWASALASQMALTPPSLDLIRQALADAPEGTAAPIVAALLQTPSWAGAANAYLQTLPPSLDMLGQLLSDQPASVSGPIVAALMQTPTWAATTVSWLAMLPPSLELLQGLTSALPAQTAGPIIAALAATPGWAVVTTAHLAALPPSLELLRAILAVAPEATAAPIVQALAATPAWAEALQGWLTSGFQAGQADLTAALRELLAWLVGGETTPQPDLIAPVPETPIPPIVVEPIIPDLILPMPDWVPPLLDVGTGGGGADIVDRLDQLTGAVDGLVNTMSDGQAEAARAAREQLDAVLDMVREARLSNVRRSLAID